MTATQRDHIGQRVKVGTIGLAIVVLLILAAGAILGAVSRDRPVSTAGGAKSETAADMAPANQAAATEPLADMGVTPATGNASGK